MEYITLMGAEAVQSAGRQMQGAADDMRRAASSIDGALRSHVDRLIDALSNHARAMDDFLDGFKGALERIKPPELLRVEASDEPIGDHQHIQCTKDQECCFPNGHDGICDVVPF